MIEKTIALPSRDQGCGPSGNFSDLARVDLRGPAPRGPSGKVTASQSGATLLSRSFSALLKIVPSNPVVLLWVASICLKLKRVRRAYEVLSRVSASDWEQGARAERFERPERPKPTNVVNLMDALRQSVEASGAATSTKAKARAASPRSSSEKTEHPKLKRTRRSG
jgi:hypothetical protein